METYEPTNPARPPGGFHLPEGARPPRRETSKVRQAAADDVVRVAAPQAHDDLEALTILHTWDVLSAP